MTMPEAEADQIRAELKFGQPSLVYEREAPLSEVLQRKKVLGDGLDLLSLTARIRVDGIPSSFIFCVDFPGAEFSKISFIDLLNQARRRRNPGRVAENRLYMNGTIADWIMPDQLKDEHQRELYDGHLAGLRKRFQDFHEKDRRKYLDATHPLSSQESEAFIWGQLNNLLTQQMAEKRMQRAEKDCQAALLTVSSVVSSTWGTNLEDTEIAFSDLPQSSKDIIVQSARKAAIKDKKVIDPRDPPAVICEGYWSKERNHPYYRVSHLGRGQIEITFGKSVVKFNLRGRWRRMESGQIVDESAYYLLPRQVWALSKSTGNRLWLDGALPDRLLPVDHRANTRLGFVLAAALSDQERDKLPSKLPLKPGGPQQSLREAQIPVLLYLTEEDIKHLVGEDDADQIIDPHLTILNGSYFVSCERFTHLLE